MKSRFFFSIVCALALALPVRAQYALQPDISVPYEKPTVFGVPEACIVSGLTVSAVGFGIGAAATLKHVDSGPTLVRASDVAVVTGLSLAAVGTVLSFTKSLPLGTVRDWGEFMSSEDTRRYAGWIGAAKGFTSVGAGLFAGGMGSYLVGCRNGSSVKDGLQPYQVLCTAGLGCALAGVVMFVVSDSCYKSAAFRNVGLRDVSLSVGGTPDGVGLVCRF